MNTAQENLQKAIYKMSFIASIMDEDNLKTMKSDAYLGLQNEAYALVELLKVTNAQFDSNYSSSSNTTVA
ncbi:MAG: hypothetical protein ACRDCZ_01550 [Culicoidibacterales bacterium]